MSYTEWHSRFVSFLVRRVIAPGFIIIGSIVAIYDTRYLMPGATIPVNGVPSDDLIYRIVSVVVPLLVLGVGILLYRAPPIRWPE
jgi:hypothetical protein